MVRYHSYDSAGKIEDLEGWCVGQTDVQSVEEGEEGAERDVVGAEDGAVGADEGVVAARSGLGYHDGLVVQSA